MTTAVTISHVEYIKKGVVRQRWDFTASGFGNDLHIPDYEQVTVQLVGIPTGAGNTSEIVIEGSNDGPTGTYTTLESVTGGSMSFVQAGTFQNGVVELQQKPLYIRPRADTVTSGVTGIHVIITAKANRG